MSSYVYKEGEPIIEIYFLLKGCIGFILPRFHTKVYQTINSGETFGHQDLFTIRSQFESLLVNSTKKKNEMKRHF